MNFCKFYVYGLKCFPPCFLTDRNKYLKRFPAKFNLIKKHRKFQEIHQHMQFRKDRQPSEV